MLNMKIMEEDNKSTNKMKQQYKPEKNIQNFVKFDKKNNVCLNVNCFQLASLMYLSRVISSTIERNGNDEKEKKFH